MLRAILLLVLIVCWPFESLALAQGRPAETQRAWKQPMTPWGEPDLRGMWPLNHLINTPFPRPEKFGERRVMTDDPEILATGKWSAAFPLKLDNDYKMRVDEQRRLIVCRYHACFRNRVR
jgi:hypothetical protein